MNPECPMPREPLFPSLRSEVDRLFDSLVHTAWGSAPQGSCWRPACDVSEEPDRYRIEMDLPGVRSGAVSITAEGRTLRIEGTRERGRRGGVDRTHLLERVTGRFLRTFHLPPDADAEGIQARLNEGVLTVEVPRRETRSAR
jgi:HSP20 family protein